MRIIGGNLRGRALMAPQSAAIRPTQDRIRENIFNILQARFNGNFAGKRVLDLFAGTGAYGLEALSRGASAAVFVEEAVEARGILRHNIENLGLGGVARILRRNACDLGPAGTMLPFHLVFADPPYGQELGEKAFISAYNGGWLHNNAILVLEESKRARFDLPACFIQEDERGYGAAHVCFYALSPQVRRAV
ncbi:MAG: 16S rRNA (guanine(966)-N(2))-methyltransferase RsmD [Candidatus Tokpelaia sp.]|uniref:16S rRNA (guanine(966)-N(2))-methyltransferase RsmD n=1 Tax=Candidatus Tokpelaia sp. TaxID=2233777 RepID=UPI0012386E46|nr:16S rRNA (guanine(966)-N(2))-methyltransferase RsmD [Candidatus Tokpelaia sp.]KAA6205183.1 MAG: 16S rRNA (guanine(966)-N(2))-methyltransferase RsmD [Candidatus Tokpelaia sp.]KAA6207395.1 MAG: 16S rRNA (guanine(966)-N(2))-methyltransferase RsmD [Candidatus Tokpelaia sp.]KAA6405094.1 16S rRNA (guanine(966)-N(2))-methyltransferase RsmD [Candidatus Tokpelaia sp.]